MKKVFNVMNVNCAVAIGAIALMSLVTPVQAVVNFTLTDGDANPTTATVNPGDFFTISLDLTTTDDLIGITYFLEVAEAQGSGQFRLTNRAIGASVFSDLTTPNGTALNATSALLDPRNNNDLGGGVVDQMFPATAPGPYFVASLTIQALATVLPGAYTIQLTSDSVGSDPGFAIIASTRTPYNVIVVPEPSTVILLTVGLFGMALRRRR